MSRKWFVIVMVDGDKCDTHAHYVESLHVRAVSEALEHLIDNVASPDEGSIVQWCVASSTCAGAARLLPGQGRTQAWATLHDSIVGSVEYHLSTSFAGIEER